MLGYLKYTLDPYVESDYTIVYFHYGLNSQNKPSTLAPERHKSLTGGGALQPWVG